MDPVDFHLTNQFNEKKKKERYSNHNAARKLNRIEAKRQCYCPSITAKQDTLLFDQQPIDFIIDNANLENHQHEYFNDYDDHLIEFVANEFIELDDDDNYELPCILDYSSDDTDHLDETNSNADDSVKLDSIPLHNYTLTSTYDYCEAFTKIARQANLSRQSVNDLLSLLKSGLPVPNNLPRTEEQLLVLLGVNELFTKRSI